LANVLNGAKNMGETSATKMVILLQFLRAVFLPWPMSWDYSFNEIPISTWSQLTPWLGLLLYALLMVVVLFRFRQWPIFSFCILFFFISTSPTNNLFFTTGSTFAERFLYVPSIAFCIVLVFLIAKALKTDIRQFPEHGRRPLFLVVGTLVLAGSVLTVVRASDWRNNKTLFSADILHAPNSTRTHYSLASELMKEAQRSVDYRKRTELLNESAASFDRSIAIHPGNFQAWYNYGLNRALAGDTVKAVNCYRRSIELSPTYQVAMNNLAVIYDAQGATDSAAAWYRRVLALDPDNAVAKSNLSNTYFNLGLRLSQAGRREEAITAYRKSAASDPSNSIPLNNLASLFASEAQYDSALVYLKKAYSIKPGEMMVIENIAAVSYLDGNYPQALEFAGKALAIQPNAQRSLGVIADTYQALGNPAEAMKYRQRLQQIR
jgi:tetratricopeptide (TPR) repeat protein